MKEDNKLVAEFIALLRVERGRADNTLLAYQRDLQKLVKHAVGLNKSLLTLDRADVVDLMADMKDSGANPSSISRLVSAVRVFYKFALTEGLTNETSMRRLCKKP